jgi:hypothetical protein
VVADSVGVLVEVEGLLGVLTAVRAAAVHAVALDTPGGVTTDQVCDELSVALARSRRSASVLRDQALSVTHQPRVWAALAGGLPSAHEAAEPDPAMETEADGAGTQHGLDRSPNADVAARARRMLGPGGLSAATLGTRRC